MKHLSAAREDVTIDFDHCGQPVTYKRSQHGWEGEYERAHYFFACEECGIQIAVEVSEHVGPVAHE